MPPARRRRKAGRRVRARPAAPPDPGAADRAAGAIDGIARDADHPSQSGAPILPLPPVDAYVLAPPPAVPLRRLPLPYEVYPFEALGVQYGSFLFRPAVELTRGYDTNPARTMPAAASWYSTVAPQLQVNSNWSRHELTATLRGSYTAYDIAGQLNRPLVDTKVNGRIDVTSLARIDLEGRYYLGTDSPGSPNIQADLPWYPIYHQLGGTAGFGQRINRFDFIGKFGADRTTYTNSHFDDGQVSSNADRNFNRYFTTGRISYELSPGRQAVHRVHGRQPGVRPRRSTPPASTAIRKGSAAASDRASSFSARSPARPPPVISGAATTTRNCRALAPT